MWVNKKVAKNCIKMIELGEIFGMSKYFSSIFFHGSVKEGRSGTSDLSSDTIFATYRSIF